MPGYDGTGPRGLGRMTGRKFGPCNPANSPAGAENADKENLSTSGPAQEDVVYGVGRGGIPRGCGQGYSGGRGRGNPRKRRFF